MIRLPRYSLRTFLIIITAICVWLGWKLNAAREQRHAVAALRELGTTIHYDYQWNVARAIGGPPEPAWLTKLLGIDFFHDVLAVVVSTDDFGKLLPHLRRCSRLQTIEFYEDFSDEDELQNLAGFGHLKVIEFERCRISDRGFKHLVKLRSLESVSFFESEITDVCIQSLSTMPNLRTVTLRKCPVTAERLDRLRQLRPDIEVSILLGQWLTLPRQQ